MSQSTIALLLALMLVLGAVPLSAFATNNNKNDDDDDDWAHEGKLKQKNRVWTGDGPPNKNLGKVGDLYIDNKSPNFKLYKKTAKFTWTVIGTLQGPPGGKGDAGQACWDLNGNGIKDLDTEDANHDGVVNVLDCSGQKGDKGDKGDTGPQGPPGTIRAQSCPAGFFVSGINTSGDLICTPLIERPAICSADKLPRADFHGCDFHDLQLVGVDLSGADLRGVNLNGADLTGANLSGAILNLANLNGAILTGTNFSGASLISADLRNTNLGAATVTGANMMDALLPSETYAGCINHPQCV